MKCNKYIARCTLSLNSNENKSCAFAVHADMSVVHLQLAEQSVVTLVRVLRTLLHCSNQLCQQRPQEPQTVRAKPETSFAVLHSVSSMSERATPVTFSQSLERGGQGTRETSNTSIWLQCTVPSVTFSLLSTNKRKFSIVLEECSLAYDGQSAYTKVSLRVRGLNSKAEDQTESGIWTEQQYQELIVSCNKELFPQLSVYIPESSMEEGFGEEVDVDHQTLATGFFNLVLTRAEVKNVHRKLKVAASEEFKDDQQRFLSEIDVEIYPLDVFVTTDCVNLFINCMLPFLDLTSQSSGKASSSPVYTNLNNNVLPLVYFKSKRFRVFIHHRTAAAEIEATVKEPDFFLLELEAVRITCQLENPLSRILVNEAVYYSAAEAGLLEVPGSIVEDRQYELVVSGISLLTGSWKV